MSKNKKVINLKLDYDLWIKYNEYKVKELKSQKVISFSSFIHNLMKKKLGA